MKIFIAILSCVISGAIIVSISPLWNPFAPSGTITGIFIDGSHEGFGEFYGQYPHSSIRLCNDTCNREHFPFSEYRFGNQYSGIDNMIEGERYKIWYHQNSRPSDTTSGNMIKYWVIDDIKKL